MNSNAKEIALPTTINVNLHGNIYSAGTSFFNKNNFLLFLFTKSDSLISGTMAGRVLPLHFMVWEYCITRQTGLTR